MHIIICLCFMLLSNALFLIYRVCYERLVAKSAYRECDLGSPDDYDKVTFYTHQSKVLDNACGKCYYFDSIDYIIYVFIVSIDYITYHNVYLYSHVYTISHHISIY